jgi:CDP-diacylglycerol--glycerol-3-phosphate 3-phosphatidyltransferase
MTDWLDGYLARKMGLSSEFGAFLDPVADKLMVATTLVLLCTRPPAMAWARVAPWLLPLPAIVIIGREITMSAVREWAASQGGDIHKTVAVNKLGKWKTVLQMVALTLLLANRNGGGGDALGIAGVSLLYIAAGLALWSLVMYIRAMCNCLTRL